MKVGCCGFAGKMAEYFKNFQVVELQKTFYSLPKTSTVERWKKSAPKNFEFSIKAWQLVTHPSTSPTYKKAGIQIGNKKKYGFFRPTDEVFDAWNKTMETATLLGCKVVLFQCPPSFKQSEENIRNMKEFFNSVLRRGLIFAWEPRGEWEDEKIEKLCVDLDLIHCVDPLVRKPAAKGEIAYYRLHGSYEKGMINYKYKYTEKDLKRLLEICKNNTYVLFNNVHMLTDAKRFLDLKEEVKCH
jgi:uncharacterized protein YecE (DUF72 family)